jgi:uncharacterized membrane protein YeiB
VILLFYALVKIVKWTLITVTYVLIELVKLGVLLLFVIFVACRGVVHRLRDSKGAKEPDELQGLYALQNGPRGVSQDTFDARWQRERDLRVAERQEAVSEHGVGVEGRSAGPGR